MRNKLFILLLLSVILSACATKPSQTVVSSDFSADSAYAFIEKQMAFGPRVPNSEAHTQCVIWLIQQLRDYGAEVSLQKGLMTDYSGRKQEVYNIIGHFSNNTQQQSNAIMLCAHYDTRPWCDEEAEYTDRYYNVPGANDGASGVGVLLEIARQLSLRSQDSTLHQLPQPVDIIFFDCEDMGTPSFYTGQQRENTWCLGSQLWAERYIANDYQGCEYQYGILLDMVGAPDATFPHEYYSMQFAENYMERIWRNAASLGYGKYFVKNLAYPITDDHYYVNLAGVPCVDIIHYDAKRSTGFASWWHTRNDDMGNISKETLQAVGKTVMSVLQ